MKIEILTIFPEYFRSPLAESLLGKAIVAGRVGVTVTDLRAFAEGRHRKVDDEPYGGGAGMVMMAPVLAAAIDARREAEGLPRAWTVLLSPDARRLDQRVVEELASRERLLLVCGRYEGIDERARGLGLFDEEISLGDFVLRQFRASCRESWDPRSHSKGSPSCAIVSTIRITLDLGSFAASQCRSRFSREITRGSSGGGAPALSSERASVAPTFSSGDPKSRGKARNRRPDRGPRAQDPRGRRPRLLWSSVFGLYNPPFR